MPLVLVQGPCLEKPWSGGTNRCVVVKPRLCVIAVGQRGHKRECRFVPCHTNKGAERSLGSSA